MGKMEKFAYKLEALLQKQAFFYKDLQNILEKEKIHIVDMDIDALWGTISRKKSLASSVECIQQEIVNLFQEVYSGLDLSDQSLCLSKVIKNMNLSPEKKAWLEKRQLEINTVKSKIANQSSENKNFINEYLSIIDGVFSTVLNRSDEKKYNNSGTVLKNNGNRHLIRAEV